MSEMTDETNQHREQTDELRAKPGMWTDPRVHYSKLLCVAGDIGWFSLDSSIQEALLAFYGERSDQQFGRDPNWPDTATVISHLRSDPTARAVYIGHEYGWSLWHHRPDPDPRTPDTGEYSTPAPLSAVSQ